MEITLICPFQLHSFESKIEIFLHQVSTFETFIFENYITLKRRGMTSEYI